MRVALLSHNARTGDAVGQQVAAKAAFFRDRGADLRVFIESDAQLQPSLEPYLHFAPLDKPLEEIAEELQQFDLLCVEYSQHYRLLDALPLLVGKRPRILLDYHGVTPPELWDGPSEAMRESQRRRGLVWFADEVVVHSRFMRHELIAATNFPGDRIFGRPLFCESRPSNGPATLRQRLKLPNERILLFVGRLAANKRVPVLIEALAELKNEQPAVHAVIIGDTSDRYQAERQRCLERADLLAVADRVHLLGHVSDQELAGAYRSADVFVMPSVHEGFCMPVIEAMAHGLPVIVAQAGALPETIGNAGLSFVADDASDLAAQIRRVLEEPRIKLPTSQKKISLVAARFGQDVLGGAERSLRLIAEALAQAGHDVEVFTTGKRKCIDNDGGVCIRRFSADPVDAATLGAAVQHLRRDGAVPDSVVNAYLTQTRASTELLAALGKRAEEFDAIIAGPYASGLTWEVARRFPQKVLLVPCFHDEALARRPQLRTVYSRVAGLLFHSVEEQQLARFELGIHHPNCVTIGTWLDTDCGKPDRGSRLIGGDKPYLLYCGRYCHEKNLPVLLEWLERYEREYPNRFRFALMGGGQLPIPERIIDLGFLPEQDKADVIAGAAAMLQPSLHESLSLVMLEAWNAGVPVIAHSGCTVTEGHLQRSGGGRAVNGYDQFRDALHDLFDNRLPWQEMGRHGQKYVHGHFGSRAAFLEQVAAALTAMLVPLREQMRRRGQQRAAEFSPEVWTERFAERVESVLHRDIPAPKFAVECTLRSGDKNLVICARARRMVIQVCVTGNRPLLAHGPQASVIRTQVLDEDGLQVGNMAATRLPEMLVPGRTLRVPIAVDAPRRPGRYLLELIMHSALPPIRLPLTVQSEANSPNSAPDAEVLHNALAAVASCVELPAGYVDVSEGMLATWKQALKRKLLQQFQSAYVDVLSRQQTEFNRSVLAALEELAECTAMLERSALASAIDPDDAPVNLEETTRRLGRRVCETIARVDELEKRLERLESRPKDATAESSKEGRG